MLTHSEQMGADGSVYHVFKICGLPDIRVRRRSSDYLYVLPSGVWCCGDSLAICLSRIVDFLGYRCFVDRSLFPLNGDYLQAASIALAYVNSDEFKEGENR